jgi:hypothetical protein
MDTLYTRTMQVLSSKVEHGSLDPGLTVRHAKFLLCYMIRFIKCEYGLRGSRKIAMI